MSFTPAAATEWDEVHIADCGWAGTLMAANKASLGAFPTTRAEREAIATDAGRPGGGASTLEQNNDGLLARYHWDGRIVRGMAAILAELTPGKGAVVQLYYSLLPKHFQRWDPEFAAKGDASFHAGYLERRVDLTLWWIDPLFHGLAGLGYKGEELPVAFYKAAASAYGEVPRALIVTEGSHVPNQSGPNQGVNPVALNISDPTPAVIDLAIGVQLYDLNVNPIVKVASGGNGLYSPFVTGNYRAVQFSTNGVKQLGLVRSADISATHAYCQPTPPPADTTPFSQADLDAAKAAEHERTRQAAIDAVEGIK